MKTTWRKNLAAFIALFLVSPLAGCGESAVQNDSDASPAQEETPVPSAEAGTGTAPETEEPFVTDSVPERDFGGLSVNMAGQAPKGGNNGLDMWVEEINGDIVNDAIFNRNLAVSERFNVVIEEPLMADYTTISSTIRSMVTAGDSTYDFVLNQLAQTSADVLNGHSMNLNEIPFLDFDMRWYPADVKESAVLNGKLYLIVSDMCVSYVGQTWSMCFNKDLTTELGIENLYDLAREGEWTVDKLRELTANIYIDVNGDGQNDEGDTYGFTMGSSGINGCMGAAFLYGAGVRYLDVHDDLTFDTLLDSERAQGAAEKFAALNSQNGSFAYTRDGHTLLAMMERCAVFAPSQLGHYYIYAREFDGTFGVLPMPKYDASDAHYATLCDAGCNCISVPITAKDPELTGAMIESMSAYSTNHVIPAYVEVSLQTKIARDEESVEMMQIVLDSRVMDFGYLYCGWNGWTWQLSSLFADPGSYSSMLAKTQKMMSKTYERIIKMFAD